MKIFITGNMGYVGPGVAKQLRKAFPGATLIGYDMGYFATSLTNAPYLPESVLDIQIFGDVRTLTADILEGVDAVVVVDVNGCGGDIGVDIEVCVMDFTFVFG